MSRLKEQEMDAYIASHQQDILEELTTFCAQPSISAQGAGIQEMLAIVKASLERRGFTVKTVPTPTNSPVVIATAAGASEMINTIMLNYIATFLVSYLVHGPLQEPGSPLGQTAMLPTHAWLVHILPRTRLHAGLIIAVIVSIIAAVVLWRTTWGFHIRVVGKNPIAAQAAGIKVNWILLSALMVSGAMAGLAGYGEVAGPQHRMIEYISPGYGYTAIVVALLGQLNPLGVLAAAILFGGLEVGATTMESAVGVPSAVVTVIQYLIVLFLIGRGAFDLIRQKLRREKQSEQHA
jgi:simple sugar transport system permease protein